MWAYDFVFDTCANRQTLKCLTIVDEWTRECLAIDVAGGIRSRRVIEVLAQLVSVHGAPRYLRSDNGPEFVATAILRWLGDAGIDTALIDPGKPWQNATDESFNGKLRDEFLSLQWFRNRMDAPREGRDDERTAARAIRDQANAEGGVMAVREQPITDGVPVFEVDTAEELSQRLVPGVYVRAPCWPRAGGPTPRTPIPRRSWPGPTGAMTRGSPRAASSHARAATVTPSPSDTARVPQSPRSRASPARPSTAS